MLTPPSRVYLAVNDPLAAERLLSADRRFTVLGGSGHGETVRREVRALCPDAVALEMHLQGADGLALLAEWQRGMAAPPRVLLLCPCGERWLRQAKEAGADEALDGAEPGVFPEALHRAAEAWVPALAARYADKRREIAEGLMRRLGAPEGLKGWACIREAAAAVICAPQLLRPLAGKLYPYLAERLSTTPGAAEKALRTAVEHTWLRGDLEGIQALFGLSVDADRGKPTNAEFIAMLGEHGRREMKRYLLEKREE